MRVLLLAMCWYGAVLFVGCKKASNNDEENAIEQPQQQPKPQEPVYTEKDLYYYSYTSIDGEPVKLSSYKGKKIMLVNTASLCSNTPQYQKLQALYDQYNSKLVIIGFPCNQFGDQEPGSNEKIKKFCTATYNVTFPLSGKIDVTGEKQDPIYKWLTSKDLNGSLSSEVAWNFQKYLVDEEGKFIAMFENYTQPNDPAIIDAIEK
jgi:glutathione peroxidase